MAPDSAPRRHYWQFPTFALGAAAVAAAVWQFPGPTAGPADPFARDLARLRAAVGQRNADPAALAPLADAAAAGAAGHPADAAEAHFLAGSAYDRLAELAPADAARWAKAAAEFDRVDPAGVPDADKPALAYRRARAAAATGTGEPNAVALALAVPPAGVDDPERRRLLGETLLRLPAPDLDRVKAELGAYLSGPHRLAADAAARLKQRLADVHIGLNEPDKARVWLRDVGPAAPADVRAGAQLRLGRLAAADGRTGDAAGHFEDALKDAALPAADVAAAQYQAGAAYLKQQDTAKARAFFERAADAAGPAAQAARVRLAELTLAADEFKGRRRAAVDHLKAAVADRPAAGFANPFVTEAEVRAAFEQAVRVAGAEADHATAVAAADGYAAVAPAGRAAEARADAVAGWAAQLGLDPAQAAAAKAKFAEAAGAYQALAQDFPTAAGKADFLRKAAKQFRNAGDAAAAATAIEALTRLAGVPDDVMTAAWVERGEALLATDQFAEGTKALRQAVARATAGGAAAQARVKLAVAHLDRARQSVAAAAGTATDAVKAEAAGMAKLGADLLDEVAKLPAESAAEKDAQQTALFELGKLHLAQNELPLAEERFRRLVTAYPAGPAADQARLYLGCTLLQLGRGDHQNDRPPGNADQLLAEAAALFERLGASDNAFLRTQADIRLANTTFLLKKFDAMPALCDRLATKYAGTVEELIVLSLRYSAERLADKPQAAAGTFARADEAYKKLPDSAFAEPGRGEEYTRAFWDRWLGQLKK